MLKITNLHASVEDKGILRGINLEVKPGEGEVGERAVALAAVAGCRRSARVEAQIGVRAEKSLGRDIRSAKEQDHDRGHDPSRLRHHHTSRRWEKTLCI